MHVSGAGNPVPICQLASPTTARAPHTHTCAAPATHQQPRRRVHSRREHNLVRAPPPPALQRDDHRGRQCRARAERVDRRQREHAHCGAGREVEGPAARRERQKGCEEEERVACGVAGAPAEGEVDVVRVGKGVAAPPRRGLERAAELPGVGRG
jgi:hypothetical protein